MLDLRGNGGGLLNEAVLCASIFLEDGNVVSTRSRTQGDRDYSAVGDAIEPRPTVVLVNRDTASAAEILTAALQQNDLATVVGTRTYGKGTFQEVLASARRRRARPHDRRVPDRGRHLDPRRGVKPRRPGRRRPEDAGRRRGARTERSRSLGGCRSCLEPLRRASSGAAGGSSSPSRCSSAAPQVGLGGGVRVRGGEMVAIERHGARAGASSPSSATRRAPATSPRR